MNRRKRTVATQFMEIEGTWEEIAAYAAELAGRRVRLIVLPGEPETSSAEPPLSPANRGMLDLLARWEQTPLTAEERAILDGLEQHLREQPLSLRQIETTL
jgi:hypothetical protein